MNVARTFVVLSGMLVPTLAAAQPNGTSKLPNAPAADLSSINQVQGAIFPQVWFQVPPGTAGILVSRSAAGGAAVVVTPKPYQG